MSQVEAVVLRTRHIEKILREQYHAQGQGLHELISSCEERLPRKILKDIRYIATTRNKLANDESFELDDLDAFLALCDECAEEITPRGGRFVWAIALVLMFVMTAGALIFYSVHWDSLVRHLEPYFAK